MECLTDQSKVENSSGADIIKAWDSSYEERQKFLKPKDKQTPVNSREKFFKSFPCLIPPYGISLVRYFYVILINE